MSDYSQGKIYMLTSEQTSDVYIGSTKETLEVRFTYHKKHYKGWLEEKPNYCYVTSFEICKYDDCKIQLIENYPCENRKELEKKEGEYQRMMDCVNKHIAGRTMKEYYEDNKERIQKINKEWREKHKEQTLKKNKEWKENNKEKLKEYITEYDKNRPRIKCVCGSEFRKADTKRHQRTQKHIKYIEEMKEKADSTNLNEFFEQIKFKLTTK